MTAVAASIDELCINTIRTLSMDAVEKAKAGHPGAPMGAAAMAYTLWDRVLKHNPRNPHWADRDRFVLSAGHASMLLYSLLHLTGYDLPLEQLEQFRQFDSKTPGHPEFGLTPGVELTTGPLGAGFGMSVGLAMAERALAAQFNRPGHTIVDHRTYGICSDGDMMEGVSSEAASLAGRLGLGKLIFLYDDNAISIEGSTDLAFTEDVGARFKAYGWQVQHVDGNDTEQVERALIAAKDDLARPSLIVAKTTIAYGSPNKAGKASAHGSPLGVEEVRLTKQALGWPEDAAFLIPEEALAHFRRAIERGREAEQEWSARFERYRAAFPDEAALFERRLAGKLPDGWAKAIPQFSAADGELASRVASGKVLNALAAQIDAIIGGSADLAPSTNTYMNGLGEFADDPPGRNIRFGVREHAMGQAVNGLALHGGFIPFGATFLVFSDYMRPGIRLAAIQQTQSIFVFTHDSIGLGEDGPTHQPVEHLASLRAMPGLSVIRPADANETAAAWKMAIERRGPTAFILSRQNLPTIDDLVTVAAGVPRGAYVLADPADGAPHVILIATGSEVSIALEAKMLLAKEEIRARVVSMPSWDAFEAQAEAYRESVLPVAVRARVAIEAASPLGWHKYVGDVGEVVGLNHFGASAPGPRLYAEFGFTADNVAVHARRTIARAKGV